MGGGGAAGVTSLGSAGDAVGGRSSFSFDVFFFCVTNNDFNIFLTAGTPYVIFNLKREF